MAQLAKELAAKPDNLVLGSVPRTHVMEGENHS